MIYILQDIAGQPGAAGSPPRPLPSITNLIHVRNYTHMNNLQLTFYTHTHKLCPAPTQTLRAILKSESFDRLRP